MTKIIAKTPKFIFALCALAIGLQAPAYSLSKAILTPVTTPVVRPQMYSLKRGIVVRKGARSAVKQAKAAQVERKLAKVVSTKKKQIIASSKKGLPKKINKVARRKVLALSKAQCAAMSAAFVSGSADAYSPSQLVAAGVFQSYGLRGGIFKRKNMPQTLVIHSTETASVATAKQIIRSWNNSGTYHAGTQYIVDRDGTIYQTVDPYYATYHVDSSKTLLGVKNENSIGIETVRTADQTYTDAQMKSLTRLSHYLKDRFQLQQIVGHGQVQPSDRSDPVLFDWTAFRQGLGTLEEREIAFKRSAIKKA